MKTLYNETGNLIFALWLEIGGKVLPLQERHKHYKDTKNYQAMQDLHDEVERRLQEMEAA